MRESAQRVPASPADTMVLNRDRKGEGNLGKWKGEQGQQVALSVSLIPRGLITIAVV